jgi:hypothetical protein
VIVRAVSDPAGVEPVTGAVTAAASAIERTGLLPRLLGPLADEIGADLVARHRQRNAEKVARKAARRLGRRLDEPGAVSPRVAHRVFEEGSYTDDDVMLEYLAGTLAAARTPDGRDDRAAYYANLVASLSADQIRLHHAVYTAAATAQLSAGERYGIARVDFDHCVYTTVSEAAAVLMPLEDVEPSDQVAETLMTLRREGLLTTWAQGSAQHFGLAEFGDQLVLAAYPSALGCLLYLWAYGIRTSDVGEFTRLILQSFDPPGPTFSTIRLAGFTNPEGWRDGPVSA